MPRGKRVGSKTPTADYAAVPRQIDIDKVSDEEIQDIVITANLTPRKCLGFKTPFQAILKELGKDVQIRFA
jgi:IS30 family transposase